MALNNGCAKARNALDSVADKLSDPLKCDRTDVNLLLKIFALLIDSVCDRGINYIS